MQINLLKEKLEGKIPITRKDLILLIKYYNEKDSFLNKIKNKILFKNNKIYDFSKLDTSEITDMKDLFRYVKFNNTNSKYGIRLNENDLNNWDTSNVTNMCSMFSHSKNFNGDISKWDVSNVIDMSYMFYSSYNFDQDISKWNISKVIDISGMFSHAARFNKPLNTWNTKNIVNMENTFFFTISFNQPLNNWDVSNVTNMNHMFDNSSFNQPLDNWKFKKDVSIKGMFYRAIKFNQNIGSWNFDNIKNCDELFYQNKSFIKKYNKGEDFPNFTKTIINWINQNRYEMNKIDDIYIKKEFGKELEDFFYNIKKKQINL